MGLPAAAGMPIGVSVRTHSAGHASPPGDPGAYTHARSAEAGRDGIGLTDSAGRDPEVGWAVGCDGALAGGLSGGGERVEYFRDALGEGFSGAASHVAGSWSPQVMG